MSQCSCGSAQSFAQCCEPILSGKKIAPTAETLMRARYSAYVHGKVGFLFESYAPENRHDFDQASAGKWAAESTWKGLEILATEKGQPQDKTGKVEFTARYVLNGKEELYHELADFRKDPDGHWYFVDGVVPRVKPIVREGPKLGRNDPCHCGSGAKLKKCCGA